MKHFEIQNTDKDEVCLVFSLSYINPLDVLWEVEENLREFPRCTRVIFDLLLSNGNTSNRFFEAYFDGRKLQNVVVSSNVENSIVNAAVKFYGKCPTLSQNNALTRIQKYVVRAKMHSCPYEKVPKKVP